ncbi:hypothetical protein Ciccas_001865 [Cichlidogyrus casuarinus]|uniref:RING-type domain-containing protein n=1 Tax=Cichlidogyrus casuarinus TaxID=1844966 RepID=A0ABD2QIY9_9PLAT
MDNGSIDDEHIIIIGNKTFDISNLPADEVHKLRHLKLQEEHKGHEMMHLEMFFMLIGGIFFSQCALMLWKTKHYRTYQMCTLAALVLVPPILAIYTGSTRFLSCCLVFIAINFYVAYIATRPTITPRTPKRVYGWFLLVHNVTYSISVAGYILLFVMIMTVGTEFLIQLSFQMLLYGIYFGVVARDFAEVCSDKMASKIGYYSPEGITLKSLPPNTCSVCTLPLKINSEDDEELFTLNCSHSFHEKCIRGWCIIGKKDICPYCKEKVDLRHTFTNPWQKPHILYGNYLDLIRYMVGWQPIVLFTLSQLNKAFGLN